MSLSISTRAFDRDGHPVSIVEKQGKLWALRGQEACLLEKKDSGFQVTKRFTLPPGSNITEAFNKFIANPPPKTFSLTLPDAYTSYARFDASVGTKLLANLTLDGSLELSSLQGNIPMNTLSFFQKALEHLGEENASHAFGQLADRARKMRTTENLQTLASDFHQEIGDLKEGESFIMPCGYEGHPSGHATILAIKCVAPQTYDIDYFDTGGEVFLVAEKNSRKNKQRLSLSFKTVPFEAIFPQKTTLLLQSLILVKKEEQDPTYDGKELYDLMLSYWGNYICIDSPCDLSTPQRDGTCTAKSAAAYLRHLIGKESYKNVHLEMLFLAVVALFKKESQSPSFYSGDNQARGAILAALSMLSHKTDKALEEGFITRASAEDKSSVIEYLENLLQEKPYLRVHEEKQLKADFFSLSFTCSKQLCEQNASLLVESTISKEVPQESLYDFPVLPKALAAKPDALEEQLPSFNSIKELLDRHLSESFAASLPVASGPSFWENVPNPKKCLESLEGLLKLYKKFIDSDKLMTPRRLNTVIALYLNIYFAAIEIDKRGEKVIPEGSAPHNPFPSIANDPHFICVDEKERSRFYELQEHFKSYTGQKLCFDPTMWKDIVLTDKERPVETNELKIYKKLLEDEGLKNHLNVNLCEEYTTKTISSSGKETYSTRYIPHKKLQVGSRNNPVTNEIEGLTGTSLENKYLALLIENPHPIKEKSPHIFYLRENTELLLRLLAKPNENPINTQIHSEDDEGIRFSRAYSAKKVATSKASRPLSKETLQFIEKDPNLSRKDKDRSELEALKLRTNEPIHRLMSWTAASRDLQLVQMITAFSSQMSLLKDPSNQSYFYLQFFKLGKDNTYDLNDQISSNPLILHHLKKFTLKGFAYFHDPLKLRDEDLVAQLFFIRLAIDLFPSAQNLPEDSKARISFETHCHDFLGQLTQLSQQKNLTAPQKALIHLHILHYFTRAHSAESLSLPDKIQILSSWFAYRNYSQSLPDESRLPAAEMSCNAFTLSLLEKNLFNESELANSCAKKISSVLGLESQATKWTYDPQKQLLHSDSIAFSISTAKVFKDNCSIEITAKRMQLSDYPQIFGSLSFEYHSVNNTTLFTHPSWGHFRIFWSEKGSELQQQIDGKWHQYLCPKALYQNYGSSLPFGLVAGHHHWLSENRDEIIITDLEMKHIATMNKSGQVKLVDKDIYISRPDDEDSLLDGFDLPRYQHLEFNEEGQIQAIELIRYRSLSGRRLRFSLNNEGKWQWDEHPQYFLASKTLKGLLGSISEYLFLQTSDGEKSRILVPLATSGIASNSTQSFSTVGKLQTPRNPLSDPEAVKQEMASTPSGSLQFLQFDVTGSQLKPLELEGKLLLALLELHEGRYLSCFNRLKTLSSVDHLTEKAAKLLDAIITYGPTCKNAVANVTAISLHAALIQATMKYHDSLEKPNNREEVTDRYERYLQQLPHVNERYKLTREQELELIDQFSSCYSFPLRARLLSKPIQSTRTHIEHIIKKASVQIDRVNTQKSVVDTLPQEEDTHFTFSTLIKEFSKETLNTVFWSGMKVAAEGSLEEKQHALQFLSHLLILKKTQDQHMRYPKEKAEHKAIEFLYTVLKHNVVIPTIPYGQVIELTKENRDLYWKVHCQNCKKLDSWWEEVYKGFPKQQPVGPEYFKILCRSGNQERSQTQQIEEETSSSPLFLREMNWKGDLSESFESFLTQEKMYADFVDKSFLDWEIPIPSSGSKLSPYKACIEEELRIVKEQVERATQAMNTEMRYFIPKDQLGELKETATKRLDSKREEALALKRSILSLANKVDDSSALEHKLKLHAKQKDLLSMEDLEELFMEQTSGGFKAANPYLSDNEIDELFQLIGRWEMTEIEHMCVQNILNGISELENLPPGSEGYLFKAHKLGEIATLTFDHFSREHDMSVDLLVFARRTGLIPRPGQLDSVDNLSMESKSPSILELMMGGGKTSVIASLWAKRVARRGKAPVLVVPNAQYTNFLHNFKNNQYTAFGQKVYAIRGSKKELADPKRLQLILEDMELALKEGHLLITTPEILLLIDHELTLAIKDGEPHRSIPLSQIKNLFRTEFEALGDEIHLLLGSKNEVTLASGELCHLPSSHIAMTKELFTYMVSDTLKINGHSLRELIGLEKNKQTLLDPNFYHGKVTPLLAQTLVKRFSPFSIIPEKFHESFVRFATGSINPIVMESENIDHEFMDYIQELHSVAKTQHIAELLVLTPHLVGEVIPSAFDLHMDRNFGRWVDLGTERKFYGKIIPYKGSKTPATTELGYPYEALVKHFMTAAHSRTDTSVIKVIAKKKLEQAQHQRYHNTPLEQTPAAEAFRRKTGVELTSAIGQSAAEHVNRSPESRLDFESDIAEVCVDYHSLRLTNNGQTLASDFFLKFSGMSGTPFNLDGYASPLPDNLLPDNNIQGRIVSLLLRRLSETAIHTPKENTIRLFLELMASNGDITSGYFDSGALFRDFDNLTVAKEMLAFQLEKQTGKKGVLFFYKPKGSSSANQLAALLEGSNEPIHLDGTEEIAKKTGLTPQQLYVFLDEPHSTGTDLKLPPTALASVTIDETMTLSLFLQVLLRLRQCFFSQKHSFIIPKPVIEALNLDQEYKGKDLPLEEETKLLFKAALFSTIKNQATAKADSFFRSLGQQMREVVKNSYRKIVQEHYLNNSSPCYCKRTLLDPYKPFMFLSTLDDVFTLFYGLPKQTSTVALLEKIGKDILSKFNEEVEKIRGGWFPDHQMINILEEQAKDIEGSIQKILDRAKAKRSRLPTSVRELVCPKHDLSTGDSHHTEVYKEETVEQQKQLDTQLELELEQELKSYQSNIATSTREETVWTLQEFTNLLDSSREGNGLGDQTMSLKGLMKKVHYKHPYSNMFNAAVFATDNYRLSKPRPLPVFHPMQRPAGQILIVPSKDGSYSSLLVSEQEAATMQGFLASLYKEGRARDVWLITPSGRQFIENPNAPPPLTKSSVDKALVEVNVFGGTIGNIHLSPSAKKWFDEVDTALITRFLGLRLVDKPHEQAVLKGTDLLPGS